MESYAEEKSGIRVAVIEILFSSSSDNESCDVLVGDVGQYENRRFIADNGDTVGDRGRGFLSLHVEYRRVSADEGCGLRMLFPALLWAFKRPSDDAESPRHSLEVGVFSIFGVSAGDVSR